MEMNKRGTRRTAFIFILISLIIMLLTWWWFDRKISSIDEKIEIMENQ